MSSANVLTPTAPDESRLYPDVTKTGNGEWEMGNGEWGIGN